jgi:hypothetical protein
MSDEQVVSSEADLAAKVAGWLRTTGLPLEMSVARTLRRSGLDVVQSDYFVDPEAGASREIDVIASRHMAVGEHETVGASLVIECKVAPNPWVMFVDGDKYGESAPRFERITTDIGSHWLKRIQFDDSVRSLPLMQLEPQPGYALTTSHIGPKSSDNAKDIAYAAVLGATKAARVLASVRHDSCEILLPTVVLRGRLFKSWLDRDNELAVEEVKRGQLIWRNPSSGTGLVIVEVVTEGALEEFSGGAKASIEQLVTATSEQVHEAYRDGIEVY